MLFLAELLANFLPGKVRTRSDYLWSALLSTTLTLLVLTGGARIFGQEWAGAWQWTPFAAVCVAAGFAIAYPTVRSRLVRE
ncbi:hypothetical protein JNUCC64_17945 [Streptomyces sp. JNUCC 64]